MGLGCTLSPVVRVGCHFVELPQGIFLSQENLSDWGRFSHWQWDKPSCSSYISLEADISCPRNGSMICCLPLHRCHYLCLDMPRSPARMAPTRKLCFSVREPHWGWLLLFYGWALSHQGPKMAATSAWSATAVSL